MSDVAILNGYNIKDANAISVKNRGIELADGTDLNSITTPGLYFTTSSAHSNTLQNIPSGIDSNIQLVVAEQGYDGWFKQIIIKHSGVPQIYIRSQGSSGLGSWYKLISPIMTKTVTGTTSSSGNISLGLDDDVVVLNVLSSVSDIAITVYGRTSWWAHCRHANSSGGVLGSTSITLTVFYMSL